MELRHLEYFLAVADSRSFTQAARRLHVVQSGVSATIKALERELGAELFVRGAGGVTLTIAGQELRPRARAALDAAHAAKDAVHAIHGTVRGTVTIGTLTSISAIDLPSLLAELHARYPEVRIQLRAAAAGIAAADIVEAAGLEAYARCQLVERGELQLDEVVIVGGRFGETHGARADQAVGEKRLRHQHLCVAIGRREGRHWSGRMAGSRAPARGARRSPPPRR